MKNVVGLVLLSYVTSLVGMQGSDNEGLFRVVIPLRHAIEQTRKCAVKAIAKHI